MVETILPSAQLSEPSNIRNVAVISKEGEHKKSAFIENLVATSGLKRAGDQDADEPRPSLKTSIVNPLHFHMVDGDLVHVQQETNGNAFIINLVHCDNNLDLSPAEVIANLRIVDGAFVVLDCAGYVPLESERSLRLALLERVKPVLVVDNVDRVLFTGGVDQEVKYQSLLSTVESFNTVISTFHDATGLGDWRVCPGQGTVAFSSSTQGWGFTLGQFAIRYAKKFGINQTVLMEKLWGDHYYDPVSRTFSTRGTNATGEPLNRAFNMFILDPITEIYDAVTSYQATGISELLQKLEVHLSESESKLQGHKLLNAIMNHFLPLQTSVLDMAVIHLPSPKTAQQYRVEVLYEGPTQDETAAAIRKCDSSAPLVLFVSRAVPTSHHKSFYAFGRVFSGALKAGQEVRIQGKENTDLSNRRAEVPLATVDKVLSIIGLNVEPVEVTVAGNLLALTLVDKPVLESCTLTTSDTSQGIRCVKASVRPVVEVVVEVQSSHLPRLVEGLKHLCTLQPSARTWASETGEYIIGGASERHINVCVKDLEETLGDIPCTVSKPYVSRRETIKDESTIIALAKSQNRFSRLWCKASPLGNLIGAIEDGIVNPYGDARVRAQLLAQEHGWTEADARKIWCFGPDSTGPNLVVDMSKGVSYLHEIKDSFVHGFQWATKEGVICEEGMRGVRLNIMDVTLCSDAMHRGGGQIIPAARRVTYASCLLATPGIQEPVYQVEVRCPRAQANAAISCLHQRDGRVISDRQQLGTEDSVIRAYLPIAQSFGFEAELWLRTAGIESVCSVFDHWETLPGCPLDKGSVVEELAMGIRRRKGLKPEIPSLDRYLDKL